jgi:RNA polymerase sigma-70 factor (ECF subfamily)
MTRLSVRKQRVERLYGVHFNTLYGMAMKSLRDRSQARDVIQESFVKLLGTEQRFATDEDAARYLFRTLRNLLIDEMRRSRRWKYQDLDSLQAERLSAGPRQEEDLVAGRLKNRTIPLPHPERGIFQLAYFEKLTDEEIAARLGIKLSTVRYILKKSRTALRDILARNGGVTERELDALFSRAKSS